MADIDVNSGGIQGTVGSFQGQVAALEAQFDEITAQTAAIRGSWEGDEASAILAQIDKFQAMFDAIRNKNKAYIAFMNQAAQDYTTEDNNENAGANNLSI